MTFATMQEAEDRGRQVWGAGRRDHQLLLVRDRLQRYALREAPVAASRQDAIRPGDEVLRIWRPWNPHAATRWTTKGWGR